MSSRVQQFTGSRTVGGVTTVGWQNLIANINDFFTANSIIFTDLWVEPRDSTKRGIDGLFAYLLYREPLLGGVAPTYVAEGNTTNDAAPAWFAAVTDADGAAFRTVALVPAAVGPSGDAENGKQYIRIKTPTAGAPPTPGAAYVGEAQVLIPALGAGNAQLFTSDLLASLGSFTIYNRSPSNPIQIGERVYVSIDPMTGVPMALPSCC